MVKIESKSSKLKYKGFPLKMKKQFDGEEKYGLTLNLLEMYFTSCLDSRRKKTPADGERNGVKVCIMISAKSNA